MVLGVHVTVGVRGCVQDGVTAIHIAAENGHKECIEVLARSGGDVNKTIAVRVKDTP